MTDPGRAPAARRRPRLPAVVRSARLRLLGWMLALAGLALALTTSATSLVLHAQLQRRTDAELAHDVTWFRSLAADLEPRSSGGVADVLAQALLRNCGTADHITLALVDGRPLPPPPGSVAANILADPAVLARFAAAATPEYGDVTTPSGHARYVAVPVADPGDPARGVFVAAGFPDRERAAITDAVRADALLGAGALGFAALVGWLVAGHVLRPLRELRDTARTVTESDLTRRLPVRGHDEIADVATTFNVVLDRLEAAFATQRRFIDDAGHELRTPITIIRGQLELLAGSGPHPAVAVATDELDRMHRMVDDLFTLTSLRHPEHLRQEPVALTDLVDEVYVKAAALGPRRWLLEEPARPAVAVLRGDRQRLTQAVIQLAQNAVQHTTAGQPIRIGYRESGGHAEIWVRDSGPGIPPGEQHRIFERFTRATTTRPAGGAGLGLAIVKAIAEAHRGRVSVRSRPGQGATFTVTLPISTTR